jgi:hypothetical protein
VAWAETQPFGPGEKCGALVIKMTLLVLGGSRLAEGCRVLLEQDRAASFFQGGEVGHVSLDGVSQRNFVSNSGLGWLRQGFEKWRAWEPGGLRWGFGESPGTREQNEHLSCASSRAA